ncbi:MAG: hypothetical protein LAO51_19535 [Acidobacteriia bacterium]|nr:hypothetical protein [Terriglobia bacterium]
MKTIVNKSHKPLKIQLHGGKVLHLGPARTGQIADEAAGEPAVRRLVESGDVEIVGEGAHSGPAGQEQAPTAHEATHGHTPTTVVLPKGNR